MDPILPADFVIEWKRQRYRAVAVEPYVTKAGGDSWLITWETVCPDCDGEFTVTTGRVFREPRRRCDDCRRPGRPVATNKERP